MCRKATAQSDWLAHFGRLTHCDHSIHARRGVGVRQGAGSRPIPIPRLVVTTETCASSLPAEPKARSPIAS